jgi:hypothetical protein
MTDTAPTVPATAADELMRPEAFAAVKLASDELAERAKRYQRAERYYDGQHVLPFATQRWRNVFGAIFEELRDNLCPLVVDALVARLRIDGFAVRTPPRAQPLGGEPSAGVAERQGQEGRQWAQDVWEHNRMDAVQNEIHEEATKKGDAYVIVWPDLEDGRACIEPNDPATIYVHYDPERPTRKLWAVKRWMDGDYLRATVYYPDRLEKYVTLAEIKEGREEPTSPDGWAKYHPYQRTELQPLVNLAGEPIADAATGEPVETLVDIYEPWPLPNPYDEVPVFHFRNRGRTGGCGQSELIRVIPLQDALNKQLMDLMVTAETAGYPQRFATGLQEEIDPETGKAKEMPFRPGTDQFWKFFGEQVQLGQLPAADLSPGVAALNDTRAEIGRVSQTPPYMMFMTTGEIPSGEALKVVDAPFDAKVNRTQTGHGNTWEDVQAFAVYVDSNLRARYVYSTEWANTQPHSLKEEAETYIHWKTLGIPDRVIWRRMGFTEQQCDEMEAMNRTAAAEAAARGPVVGPDGQPLPGVTPPQLRPYAVAAATRANDGGSDQAGEAQRE